MAVSTSVQRVRRTYPVPSPGVETAAARSILPLPRVARPRLAARWLRDEAGRLYCSWESAGDEEGSLRALHVRFAAQPGKRRSTH
jgi:hypothetical protein